MAADVGAGSALAFAQSLSRLFGTAPLYLGPHESVLYYVHTVYSVFVNITFSFLGISGAVLEIFNQNFNTTDVENKKATGMHTKLQSFSYVINMLLAIIIINVGAWTGRDRMLRIREIYEQTIEVHLKINNKKKWREILRIVASFLIVVTNVLFLFWANKITLDYAFLFVNKWFPMILMATYIFLITSGLVMVLEIVFFMFIFHDAMELLNDELKEIIKHIHSTRPLTDPEDYRLRRISRTYLRIGDHISQFNQDDGVLLLLLLFYCFLSLLFCVNKTMEQIFNEGFSDDVMVVGKWALINTGLIWALVEPSYQFQREVDKLRVLMTKLMLRTQAPGEQSGPAVHVFIQQLMLDAPTFTPLGMFTISRSLLTTVISTAVTCIIFVVQLRTSDENDL